MDQSNFEWALRKMKGRSSVARDSWPGNSTWVELYKPGKDDPMDMPYLCMKNLIDGAIPWVPSQGDMLAEDWVLRDTTSP